MLLSRLSLLLACWPLCLQAAPLPRHEFDQRLYLSAGESPDYQSRFMDADTEPNGVLRYEPRYQWRSDTSEWHRWDAQLRAKFLVSAGQASSLQVDDTGQVEEDEQYAELRDAWVRRRMLVGQPALSLVLGRQSFKDDEGLYWDFPLESLSLQYQASRWRGQLTLGQQLASWRSDGSQLDPRAEDIRRVLFSLGHQWRPGHWWDWRIHGQQDASGRQTERLSEQLDGQDFDGVWAGLRLAGESGSDNHAGYIVNAIYQYGELRRYGVSGGQSEKLSQKVIEGGLFTADLYGRLDSLSWRPTLGVRMGTTNSPGNANDGYFENSAMSNRRLGVADLSTSILGDMLDFEMHNLAFGAAYYRQQLWPRAEMEIMAGSLQRRNEQLPSRSNIRNPQLPGDKDLGRLLNLSFGWRAFPRAVTENRQMRLSTRVSYSMFDMGDAYQRPEPVHQVLLIIAGRW
ncbi:outer membrane alginate export protein [Alcanivorax hongdengensis A-11-3]|uniref:Outer membrane alginate export protein n=1 Tax=Alcanivorax hongdengensis A-11-3 TaxID=1177179 RepID=L0WCC1_9GAMM|nr:alginate export family protein [Alcanivorax hongdengensis]EKF74403.1 outer membrane alginate export protein [Alcanivorax hongdengensis A-11-3]